MIFPIGDDNIIGGFKPIFSYMLIGFNVLAFFYQIMLPTAEMEAFVYEWGLIPRELSAGKEWIDLLSSMFLHAGLFHILGNMLFLWIFADNIEAIVGNSAFLLYYLVGGLFASIVHIYTNPVSTIPTVGASGAISAVMGSYLVMFPKSRIKVIFIIKKLYIPAFIFLGLWFVQQLVSGISTPTPGDASEGGGVAWWAHIGGFVYGLAMGFLFKKWYGHRYSYTA